jgi:radical SAM protein with 4Fe4S-binding SPASM domain
MRQVLPSLVKNLLLKRPTTTVLFVTNRCNLDCKMCFYTERQRRDELSAEEIRRLAMALPAQTYIMFTGGEPFLRKDIVKIVSHFYENGALNLHISTNATLHERTISGIRQIALYARKARVIVVTSIDGPPEIHDAIRGSEGSYIRTIATTRKLVALKKGFPNLAVISNFTFTSFNQDYWKETIDFLRDDVKVDAVNIGLVRGRVKEKESKQLDLNKYWQANRYLIQANRRNYFSPMIKGLTLFKEIEQVENIVKIARDEPPPHYRCLAGRVFTVISETGDVYPCEMLDRKIGNLRDVDMDFMRLWRSEAAREITAYIDKRECLCTYECAMGPSIASSYSTLWRAINFMFHYKERMRPDASEP